MQPPCWLTQRQSARDLGSITDALHAPPAGQPVDQGQQRPGGGGPSVAGGGGEQRPRQDIMRRMGQARSRSVHGPWILPCSPALSSSRYPTQPCRFGKLLLLLPALRSISPSTIEEVFFKKTIGNVPITRLLSDMYKSSDI